MIKAVIKSDGGRTLFLLGISEENVRRLRDGKPIKFAADDYGLPGWDIAIAHGETEQSLIAELRANGVPVPVSPSCPSGNEEG